MDRWGQFNSIVEDENLDVKEKGLLLIIFRYINHKTGYANPSRELIKKLYGTKKNDVIDKVFKSLENKGYLVRESGVGIRTKYFIKVGTEIEPSTDTEPSSKIEPQVGTEIEPTVGTQIEPQKEKEKKKEKKNIYIENQNSVSVTYMDLKFIDSLISEVKITEEEYKLLTERYSKKLVHDKIKALDGYKDLDKFGSHVKVLNSWCDKDKDKEEYKDQPQKKRPKKDPYASVKGDYDYLKPKDPPAWVVDWT